MTNLLYRCVVTGIIHILVLVKNNLQIFLTQTSYFNSPLTYIMDFLIKNSSLNSGVILLHLFNL